MKLRTKQWYLAYLLGLSCIFTLLSTILLWVATVRPLDRMRQLFSNLMYETLAAETTKEGIITHVRDAKRLVQVAGIDTILFQLVVFDKSGTVIADWGEGNLADAWKTFPPVTTPGQQMEYSTFGGYTTLFPLPRVPGGAVMAIRLGRFGQLARSVILGTILFGAWVAIGSAIISMGLIRTYFRSRAEESRRVFSQILGGNLKARFRPDSLDDAAQLMILFNGMATKIEDLVNRLKETESQRTKILQEISHDTRTPLTSARTSLEMIHEHYDRLTEEERKRCVEISLHEILYLHQLIDDLFFLAEMDEPRQADTFEPLDLLDLVEDEIQRRRATSPLEWRFNAEAERRFVVPGSPRLFVRLIRNALDNAARHATGWVEVKLTLPSTKEVCLTVENDGELLGEDVVSAFGVRRPFQKRPGGFAGGKSLGLGSVIIDKIAELHHGKVRFSARDSGGARLDVTIPAAA